MSSVYQNNSTCFLFDLDKLGGASAIRASSMAFGLLMFSRAKHD